jgi:hypothetical protein
MMEHEGATAGSGDAIALSQVRAKGRLLAPVGGNARYGGIADLCGISSSDTRDNTVARFAVVRRERLAAELV